MSNEKSNLKEVSETAKKIWLAGLGAYGRALDEAQEQYEQASGKTPRLFKELVEKGKKLESQARTTLDEVIDDVKAKNPTASLEERISKVRANLGLGGGVSIEDFERLEKKVDALAKKINAMTPKAAATKKASAKKSATSKTAE